MKNHFIKLWLIVFSLSIGVYSYIKACGSDWEEPDVASFSAHVFEDIYSPELYTDFLSEVSEYPSRFDEDILTDWENYFEKKINREDLSKLLLEYSFLEIDSLFAFTNQKIHNKLSYKWNSGLNLKDKKIIGFIGFLHFAKKVEAHSIQKQEDWQYNDFKEGYVGPSDELILQLTRKFKTTQDNYLKNRYWFQTVKAYFYSEKRDSISRFFDLTESTMPRNLLYFRALSYVAGVESLGNKTALANYRYSLIFDQCEPLQRDACFGFRPQEDADWIASLSLTKSNKEKVALWAMFGYYADEKRAIEEIFKLSPESKYLDDLLSQLIYKEERRIQDDILYSAFPITNFGEYKIRFQEIQSEDLYNLVQQISLHPKVKSPQLWLMAYAYLNTLHGKYTEAEQQYSRVEKLKPLSENAQKQLRLMRFINTLSAMNAIGEKEENSIYPELQWLYEDCPKADTLSEKVFHYLATYDWSKMYLAYLYKEQGNPIMAELFQKNDEIYKDEQGTMAMRGFLLKTDKTPLEDLMKRIYTITVNDIDEFRAVRFGYNNDLETAIKLLEQPGIKSDPIFPGDPFLGNIKDCNDCDHSADQKIKYSRLELLKKMLELKKEIAQDKKVYQNAILMANAFYSISYYGNGRVYFEGDINGGYYINAEDIPGHCKNMLLDMKQAEYYYKLALKNAKSDEQKAKCWFMLSKCERNTFYNSQYYGIGENKLELTENKDFVEFEGFKQLDENFSKTKYFKEVIAECGYFRTYSENKKVYLRK